MGSIDRTYKKKAVIYARVSSIKQTTRGDGLGSQETRCREYAKYKGYEVVDLFKDDLSGSLVTRPGMKAMLKFLKTKSSNPHVVIIDDISRLARGLEAHLELRSAISDACGILESPSIEFGEDSDSLLVENLLASVSQHQRQKNGEQTKNRMRARTLNGYYCFHAPLGYKYSRVSGHGNLLVRDEPVASALQEALEGFATGRFGTQTEMKRFLEAHPHFPVDQPDGEIRATRVRELLQQVLYAGMIQVPNWDVSLREGKHECIISYETYLTNQRRLTEGGKMPVRKDTKIDFPLRGFVTCGDCERPLTACWSSGKLKKYPYYFCFNKTCPSFRKSHSGNKMHEQFEDLLSTVQPTQGLFKLAYEMFKDIWDHRLKHVRASAKTLKNELSEIDKQIEQLLDRIVDAKSDSVVSAYEKRISKLEQEKLKMREKIAQTGKPQHSFEEKFEHACQFLSNPLKLWVSDRLEDKIMVLKLVFAGRISYARNEGFRTPKIALPFKVLGQFSGEEIAMAPCKSFEFHLSDIENLVLRGKIKKKLTISGTNKASNSSLGRANWTPSIAQKRPPGGDVRRQNRFHVDCNAGGSNNPESFGPVGVTLTHQTKTFNTKQKKKLACCSKSHGFFVSLANSPVLQVN